MWVFCLLPFLFLRLDLFLCPIFQGNFLSDLFDSLNISDRSRKRVTGQKTSEWQKIRKERKKNGTKNNSNRKNMKYNKKKSRNKRNIYN